MSQFQKFQIDAPQGINFSIEPSQLNPKTWDNGNNISFVNGSTKKCPGYDTSFGLTLATPEASIPLRDANQEFFWWSYAGKKAVKKKNRDDKDYQYEQRIYRISSSSSPHELVSPEIPPDKDIWTNTRWFGDSINNVPYFVREKIYVWVPDENKFQLMDSLPPYLNFRNVRTFRNFMIGLNYHTDRFDPATEPDDSRWKHGYAFHPNETVQNGVWWSQDISSNSLQVGDKVGDTWPAGLWEDANPNRNSGWNVLGGSGGPIIDGKTLRDKFVIYREGSVWLMSFIGGNDVFGYQELFNDVGIINGNCVQEADGVHYVVGHSDVYAHNGSSKYSICDGVIRRQIFSSINEQQIDKIFTTIDYSNKEFWVCVPTEVSDDYSQKGCQKAYIYNWMSKVWSIRDIPELISASYSIISLPEKSPVWIADSEGGEIDPLTGNALIPPASQAVGVSWEETYGTWTSSSSKYSAADWGLVLGSATQLVPEDFMTYWDDYYYWDDLNDWHEENPIDESSYYLFTSNEDPIFNGENFIGVVEKKWLELSGGDQTSFVSKVYPDVRNGTVDVYVSGTFDIEEDPLPYYQHIGTFPPTDPYTGLRIPGKTHLDCRVSGNYIHVRFQIPETSRAEVKGFGIDFTTIGRR